MDQKRKHSNTIIKNHVIWSMGAGLIPIMAADILAITALQLDMIRQLSKVYDVSFKETRGKAIVTSITATTLTRMGARSLVKFVPVFGSFVGGAALSVFAGASTYALGQVFIQHFNAGGTILDFDPESIKNFYNEQFEKGKEYAREWRKKSKKETTEEMITDEDDGAIDLDSLVAQSSKAPAEENKVDLIAEIEKLSKLKEQGFLDDEEFKSIKARLIDKFSTE